MAVKNLTEEEYKLFVDRVADLERRFGAMEYLLSKHTHDLAGKASLPLEDVR